MCGRTERPVTSPPSRPCSLSHLSMALMKSLPTAYRFGSSRSLKPEGSKGRFRGLWSAANLAVSQPVPDTLLMVDSPPCIARSGS
jgi:hypothetical protein